MGVLGHTISRSSSLNERERVGLNFLEEECYYEHMREQTATPVEIIPSRDSQIKGRTTPNTNLQLMSEAVFLSDDTVSLIY